jgi:sugar/nucleoside kinase (ribokinase family)
MTSSVDLDAPWDVLSVGDATADVFIRLPSDHVRLHDDERGRWMDLPFGAKVPFDFALTVEAGGNAANAAVGLARLGLRTALAAHAGEDQIGRAMTAALHREGVDTHLVRLDPGQPSNRNFVLWLDSDRTILVHHEIYDYHWPDLSPREVPRWLYLSSVGSDAPEYYARIATWLGTEPAVHFAFQPGTFQIALGVGALASLYRRADLLVCNREEAVEIGGGDHSDVGELLEQLHGLGPKTVVVTDGSAGAYASDTTNRYVVPAYPDPAPPLERTGAGDAFSSALVAALARERTLPEALAWAPINAMSVVQEIGSQTGLLTEPELLSLLDCAPEEYKVTSW